MRGTLSWVGLAIVVTGVAALVFADVFTDLGSPQGDVIVSLVTMTALLVVIGGGTIGAYWGKGTMLLRHIAIWLAIVAAISLIYTYRSTLGFDLN
jgi:hypothetical protein